MRIDWEQHRVSAGAADTAVRHRRAVPAALVLLAIAIALLCALIPFNSQGSNAPGSAFNPSNTHVSLQGPVSSRSLIKRLLPGGNGNGDGNAAPLPGDALLFAPVALLTPPLAADSPVLAPDRPGAPPPAAPRRDAYPRGPPRA